MLAGLCACEARGLGLDADVRTLLDARGIAAGRIACRHATWERDGTCALGLTPAAVGRAVAALGLRAQVSGDPATERLTTFLARRESPGCQGTSQAPRRWPQVWFAGGRPPALRLTGGTAFEYLALFYDPESGAACLDLSYAYG